MALRQFQRGGQRAAARRTQPGQARQRRSGEVEQPAQRSMLGQQIAGGLHGIAPACARAEEDGQQLRIREHAGALREQAFAGSFLCGPVVDRHADSVATHAAHGHGAAAAWWVRKGVSP